MAKLPSPFKLPLSRKWQEHGHSGVDWAKNAGATLGATIRASGPGLVTFSGLNNSRSGYVTTITYDNGVMAMYCHREPAGAIAKGSRVVEGTPIAKVGYSGNVVPAGPGGAHLHLEVYVGGRLVNPGDYFDFNRVVSASGGGSPAGVSNQVTKDRQSWVNSARGEKLAVDGIEGPDTKAAYKRYQTFLGVTADGIWGTNTQKAHQSYYDKQHSGRGIVKRGSTGNNVRDLQARLNRDYSLYSKLVADGIFGPGTENVVKEFQRRAGLVVDGIVGAQTWKALGL